MLEKFPIKVSWTYLHHHLIFYGSRTDRMVDTTRQLCHPPISGGSRAGRVVDAARELPPSLFHFCWITVPFLMDLEW